MYILSSDTVKIAVQEAVFAVDGGMQTRWIAKEKEAELVVDLNPTSLINPVF